MFDPLQPQSDVISCSFKLQAKTAAHHLLDMNNVANYLTLIMAKPDSRNEIETISSWFN